MYWSMDKHVGSLSFYMISMEPDFVCNENDNIIA